MAKPRRHDPCPCGSGRRFKECCLSTKRLLRPEPPAEALHAPAAAEQVHLTPSATQSAAKATGASQRVLEKQALYDAWIDEPHRSLGGMTPRQAATDGRAWRKLEVVIKVKEHHELELPEALRFDFAALRRKLGLPT